MDIKREALGRQNQTQVFPSSIDHGHGQTRPDLSLADIRINVGSIVGL